MQAFNQKPLNIIKGKFRDINVFDIDFLNSNISEKAVHDFGEEWLKFNSFSEEDLEKFGKLYFDFVGDKVINSNTYMLDVGCGTGRWSKYLSDKVKFIEAIDPSKAIFAADRLLGDIPNIRLSNASTNNIPFDDKTFDFVMSVGVLHHIPDTKKALADCVAKVKIGGHMYAYIYYAVENRGLIFRGMFKIANYFRKLFSNSNHRVKSVLSELLAFFVYLPFVYLGKFFKLIGLKSIAQKLPLSLYQNASYFIIRNDALDRFNAYENRFTKDEIIKMFEDCGLTDIVISTENKIHWCAVGKKER